MHKLFEYLIDFIFPPSVEELQIRSYSVDWLYENGQKAGKTEFTFIKALFPYKNPIIKELIWQIKYKKNQHAIKCASYALYKNLYSTKSNITLIPLPISPKRRRERGYNQTELIIDQIIKFDKEKVLKKNYDLLIREKDIEKQTHKNRNERISNTKHIFKVNFKENLNDKIVIIDDVTTTGSTLKEARDELLKAGYTNIDALTIAH